MNKPHNNNIEEKDLIIRLLSALLPEATIYLFGSRARGDFKESSDIDIAIDLGRELSIREISRAKRILEALYIVQKIDVVDFFSAPKRLQDEILNEGIIWKKKNG